MRYASGALTAVAALQCAFVKAASTDARMQGLMGETHLLSEEAIALATLIGVWVVTGAAALDSGLPERSSTGLGLPELLAQVASLTGALDEAIDDSRRWLALGRASVSLAPQQGTSERMSLAMVISSAAALASVTCLVRRLENEMQSFYREHCNAEQLIHHARSTLHAGGALRIWWPGSSS